jgi:hypothetical protein
VIVPDRAGPYERQELAMIEDMGEYGRSSVPSVPPPGETPPSRSRSKARGVAAGLGVALVVGAGGIAVASSGGTTSSGAGATPTATEGAPTPGAGQPGRGGRGVGGPGFGPVGGLAVGADVLHGTYVVAKSGGGYQTIETQNGTVDSVSSTSLAVKSKDGFTATYVVKAGTIVDAQSAGIGSVKKGDTVTVSATVSGKTATIDRVVDLTLLQKSMPTLKGGYGKLPSGGAGGQFRGGRTAPSPNTTPGATT